MFLCTFCVNVCMHPDFNRMTILSVVEGPLIGIQCQAKFQIDAANVTSCNRLKSAWAALLANPTSALWYQQYTQHTDIHTAATAITVVQCVADLSYQTVCLAPTPAPLPRNISSFVPKAAPAASDWYSQTEIIVPVAISLFGFFGTMFLIARYAHNSPIACLPGLSSVLPEELQFDAW